MKKLELMMKRCRTTYLKVQLLEEEIIALFNRELLETKRNGVEIRDIITTYLNYGDLDSFNTPKELIDFLESEMHVY